MTLLLNGQNLVSQLLSKQTQRRLRLWTGPEPYLVVLGWGYGLQVVTADADHLLRLLHEDGAHPPLRTHNKESEQPGQGHEGTQIQLW